MTFAFGSFTLGAALLYSAFKNMSMIELVLGAPGTSIAAQGESHPHAGGGSAVANAPAVANAGGYVSPFGPGATSGRIDQGKDVGGSGPIRAIGNAVIVKTGAPGWPSGQGIVYKLLDGPHAGRCVYVYEGVHVMVKPGQRVTAGQTIGSIIPGTSTGIETGWATCSGVPLSHGEYSEGKETKAGKAFASFLRQLGFK